MVWLQMEVPLPPALLRPKANTLTKETGNSAVPDIATLKIAGEDAALPEKPALRILAVLRSA